MSRTDLILKRISFAVWPELYSMSQDRRLIREGDVIGLLYTIPLATFGIVWLILSTEIEQITDQLFFFLFNFLLIFIFAQLNYFIIVEIRTDRFGSSDASFATMVYWSAIFLLGPNAIWIMVAWLMVNFISNWRLTHSKTTHWNLARNLSMESAFLILAVLISLEFYQLWGGQFPLRNLSLSAIIPAFLTLALHLFLVVCISSVYILYHFRAQKQIEPSQTLQPMAKFFLWSFGLPYLANPFAILVAGLYVENGFPIYIFTLVGLLLVALLARQLSRSAEYNRQQSRQLEILQKFGRELIDAPPGAPQLSELLGFYVPNMFPSGHITIGLSPDQI
jgi:hypothetical protein